MTFQESVIAVWLFAVVCPVGRFPVTEKLKESLLGSCAVIDILADVFTVTFTSNGPTKIFGGKFSAKQAVETKTGRKRIQNDHRFANSCWNRHSRNNEK